MVTAFFGGAFFGGEFFSVSSSQGDGKRKTGWEDYVAPKRKKTLKQYKQEYLELSYFEIEEEKEKAESQIKLAESDLKFNVELGLKDVIVRLKAIIQIEKIKVAALNWVVNERRLKAERIARQSKLDADIAFVAAYLMDDDYE